MFQLLYIPWFKWETIPLPFLPDGMGLHPFGFLVAIGVLLGIHVATKRAQRLGIRADVINDFITHVVVIGFIGSHVFDRVFYYPEIVLRKPWDLLMPWKSMSSFGGFLFAVVGAFVWKYRRKLDITIPLDQVAFGLPVGWIFGRTGCFIVKDHPGKITDFFLAVNDYQYHGMPVGPRHDLGLYEIFWAALIIPLFFYLDRKPRPHGFYIGMLGVLYGPYRFMLDFLRDADLTYFGLTAGHYSSVVSFVAGAWMLWRAYKRPITTIPPAMLEAKPNNDGGGKRKRAKPARAS